MPTRDIHRVTDAPHGAAGDDASPFLTDAVLRSFSGESRTRWIAVCRRLDRAGYGNAVVLSYVRHGPAIARAVGADAAIALAETVSLIAIKAGRAAAEALPVAALRATERLADGEAFRAWTAIIGRFAALAPESVRPVLDHTDRLLTSLDRLGLESWLLAGVRSSAGDATRRRAFFTFTLPEAERWLRREAGDMVFADIERRLKAYLMALWRLPVTIREPFADAGGTAVHRASLDRGLLRIPPVFPGFVGDDARRLFRACLAHLGAHLRYTRTRFPVARLKPMQVAMVSLIEDARVERLAMRDLPGLIDLWRPFHKATPDGPATAENLFARLSRALIDPDYDDPNGWVRKGRAWFQETAHDWDDPQVSRVIGGRLGNDLGQMRVQLNSRTYLVEPIYRDDNLGLWDFGDAQTPEAAEAELLFESIRIAPRDESDATAPDHDRDEVESDDDIQGGGVVMREVVEEGGMPVARYPEYDHVIGRARPDWTTVVEYAPAMGSERSIQDFLESRIDVVTRLSALVRSARIGRPERRRRQSEGSRLDIDSCIDAVISRRRGESPDPRIFTTSERRRRDLSALVLLDVSESTNDRLRDGDETVITLERQATAVLAHVLSSLGDPFAIAAFCSNRRDDVRYYRIKDFDAPYGAMTRSRLAGLTGRLSTRIGAAIRHATEDLVHRATYRRLLLVITDGEPSDIDVSDRKYLVEDARRAVIAAKRKGIDVFCVGLDSGGDSYLGRVFGRNVLLIDRIERLPERLPMLYFRLTA